MKEIAVNENLNVEVAGIVYRVVRTVNHACVICPKINESNASLVPG
jgi:hypothetical protein